jgi:hypothetical protein
MNNVHKLFITLCATVLIGGTAMASEANWTWSINADGDWAIDTGTKDNWASSAHDTYVFRTLEMARNSPDAATRASAVIAASSNPAMQCALARPFSPAQGAAAAPAAPALASAPSLTATAPAGTTPASGAGAAAAAASPVVTSALSSGFRLSPNR